MLPLKMGKVQNGVECKSMAVVVVVVSCLLATHLSSSEPSIQPSSNQPSIQPFIHPLQLLAMHFSWLHFISLSTQSQKWGEIKKSVWKLITFTNKILTKITKERIFSM